MAKTTAPLLSFGGSGQIGKTQVYSKWRGISYARRYVKPAYTNSDTQATTRGVFSWLNAVWKTVDPAVQAPWTLFAKGRPFTNRNSFISKNLPGLRGTSLVPATDLSGGIMSPGANAGFAAASIAIDVATPGHLKVTITPPSLPAGWDVVAVHVVAFKQQNAQTDQFYTSYYDTAVAGPWQVNLTVPAATYQAFGWVEFTKPDGSTAYSPSLTDDGIVT